MQLSTPEMEMVFPGCLSETSHAPQQITLAKPGRVVGPLPPFENGNLIKQAYDPRKSRTLVRNAVIPPQVGHPVYCHRRNGTVKQERSMEMEKDSSLQAKQVP